MENQQSGAPKLLLAHPRGFCAGVDRAIAIVERALSCYGSPVYVRHEVVHNTFVVAELRAKGAIFVETLAEIPRGSIVIFSAHGVSQQVKEDAQTRGLTVFDATCPLVTKVHNEVVRMRAAGNEVIMIGHAGHPEVEGTLGQSTTGMYLVENEEDAHVIIVTNAEKVVYVTQTTLSVDDTGKIIAILKERFPHIVGPKKDDICYATQNRQDAVKRLTSQCDLILVIGSPASSNSNRLCELARQMGIEAYLIENKDALRPEWLVGKRTIGVTAGASTPEILVNELTLHLNDLGVTNVCEIEGIRETVIFPMPKNLPE